MLYRRALTYAIAIYENKCHVLCLIYLQGILTRINIHEMQRHQLRTGILDSSQRPQGAAHWQIERDREAAVQQLNHFLSGDFTFKIVANKFPKRVLLSFFESLLISTNILYTTLKLHMTLRQMSLSAQGSIHSFIHSFIHFFTYRLLQWKQRHPTSVHNNFHIVAGPVCKLLTKNTTFLLEVLTGNESEAAADLVVPLLRGLSITAHLFRAVLPVSCEAAVCQ